MNRFKSSFKRNLDMSEMCFGWIEFRLRSVH